MANSRRSLSIIMPALNEQADIGESIDTAVYAARSNFEEYELIVINDGSTDRTPDIVREKMAGDPAIRLVTHEQPWGFGASYNDGRQRAEKEYCVMIHADNVFERENLRSIFGRVGEADVVCGYIANPRSRNLVRRLISSSYTLFMNCAFGMRLRYFNGIQIHPTNWLRTVHLSSVGFGFQAELLIKAIRSGKSYVQVPYVHRERPGGGATKIFKPKNIVSVLKTIVHLYRCRPGKESNLEAARA